MLSRASQPYASLKFRISISFPSDYPYHAPAIKFDSPCFHPNVDIASGAICLDILNEKWSAVYSVQTILLSLQSLLGGTSGVHFQSKCFRAYRRPEPNNASPLNSDAANLWDSPDCEFFSTSHVFLSALSLSLHPVPSSSRPPCVATWPPPSLRFIPLPPHH